MGNLLGAPVTDKETHVGKTKELEFGLSSMQGWRVHMEDAHIAEVDLYAVVSEEEEENTVANPQNSSSQKPNTKKRIIELPGHSLFAVFDGHGGTFAAQYAGDNLCRILSKDPMFVQYAQLVVCQQQQQQEVGGDKEMQVAESGGTSISSSSDADKAQSLRRQGMELLESALKRAFIEVDYEIALAIRGTPHPEANQSYHPKPHCNHTQNHNNSNNKEGDHPNHDNDTPMDDAMMTMAHQAAVNHSKALDDDGDSGTTACCVLVTPDWFVCANAGDSRAVYSKSQRAVPLSYDHKPDDEEEERRIRAAGGYVAGGRVEGDLAVSRGLGDFRFKHMPTVLVGNSHWNTTTTSSSDNANANVNANASIMNAGDQKVSPVPDIIFQSRNTEQDEFVLIACDGIWDVRTNQEGVAEVAMMFQEGESDVGLVCEELLDICLRLGSKDNMTALVIKFPAQKVGDGGGVMERRKEREDRLKENEEESQMEEQEGDPDSSSSSAT